jgi:hypothetical protein
MGGGRLSILERRLLEKKFALIDLIDLKAFL